MQRARRLILRLFRGTWGLDCVPAKSPCVWHESTSQELKPYAFSGGQVRFRLRPLAALTNASRSCSRQHVRHPHRPCQRPACFCKQRARDRWGATVDRDLDLDQRPRNWGPDLPGGRHRLVRGHPRQFQQGGCSRPNPVGPRSLLKFTFAQSSTPGKAVVRVLAALVASLVAGALKVLPERGTVASNSLGVMDPLSPGP